MKLENKKTVAILLMLICILQIAMALFWTKQKNYLFMDEMFSYASANNAEKVGTVFPENEWLDEEWFFRYMSVQKEHRFDYKIPYYNQDKDVHPPLFYMFLHTACSVFPGQISYFAGVFWNIVFYVGCTILLYFLGKTAFTSRSCGLLVAFLYAISFGGMNAVVFIRMYMLMTFIVLAHMLICVKYFQEENISLQGYILLGFSLIAGVLTQYYFLFVAFFSSTWICIKYIISKEYKKLRKYVATVFASGLVTIALYPTIFKHLLSTGRSEEALGNFTSTERYLSNLKSMWKLIDSQLFTNMSLLIFAGCVAIIILLFVRNQRKKIIPNDTIKIIVFVSIGYFLLVTKVAPYQIDRYVMPIYPLVYMVIVGGVYGLLKEIIKRKYAYILSILGFAGLSIIHMIHSGIPYTYARDQIVLDRLSVAEKHQDLHAIYIGPKDDMASYYDVLQVLIKYQGYYNVNDLNSVSEIKEDMEILKQNEDVVVYIEHQDNVENVYEFVRSIFDISRFGEDNLIDQDEKWNVFLVER